jgi:hypothetical protein
MPTSANTSSVLPNIPKPSLGVAASNCAIRRDRRDAVEGIEQPAELGAEVKAPLPENWIVGNQVRSLRQALPELKH